MRSAETFSAFGDTFLIAVTRDITEQLKQQVAGADLSYVASVNPAEYVAGLAEQFAISPLIVDVDHAAMSPREETARVERFDVYSGRQAGDPYTRQIVTVHVPFTGDPAVFRYQASARTICPCPIWVDGGEVCFDVIVHAHPSADIKAEVKRMLACLSENARCLGQEIARFNHSLAELAKGLVDRRRAELQERLGILEKLDLPLRKVDAVRASVYVPVVRKTLPAPRPAPGSTPYRRSWTLDENIYEEILQAIQDRGRSWERLPRAYAGKGEEALRDELIVQLASQFGWASTTGETFNKAGKTDILMRYEQENLFVAECKFWRGRQQHFATIDQLLKYLTWRDAKTAIIYFLDTREVTTPLRGIPECTPEHPCFVAAIGTSGESRFDFTFHLPDDPERTLHIAILCFHLPKPKQDESSN